MSHDTNTIEMLFQLFLNIFIIFSILVPVFPILYIWMWHWSQTMHLTLHEHSVCWLKILFAAAYFNLSCKVILFIFHCNTLYISSFLRSYTFIYSISEPCRNQFNSISWHLCGLQCIDPNVNCQSPYSFSISLCMLPAIVSKKGQIF